MDKYEYNLKIDQMKSLCAEGNYEAAAEIADSINWSKVKNVNALVRAGEVYEQVGKYEDSRDILLSAYDRSPIGRMIIFRLAGVAIKMEDFAAAEDYYQEFIEIAPHDNLRYVIRYEIRKAQGADPKELIQILEELKEKEYTEEWAFELAYLYHRAGESEKCIEACDELILWFGDGPYVERALELKMLYQPLNKAQEEKYRRFRLSKEGITSIGAEEMRRAGEYVHEPVEIPQVLVNPERFNTVNLQEEIAKGMQQIIDATEKETVSDTIDSIKKIVTGNIPYLQIQKEEMAEDIGQQHIATDEEIDDSLKQNFQGLLGEDADGQISLVMSDHAMVEKQITGQLSIADVLEEWERTRRAAEIALQEAEQMKLESAKARALQEAEDIMDRLNTVIPKLDAGVSPKELLESEYLQGQTDSPSYSETFIGEEPVYPEEMLASQEAPVYSEEPLASQETPAYAEEPAASQETSVYSEESSVSQEGQVYPEEMLVSQEVSVYPEESVVSQEAPAYADEQPCAPTLDEAPAIPPIEHEIAVEAPAEAAAAEEAIDKMTIIPSVIEDFVEAEKAVDEDVPIPQFENEGFPHIEIDPEVETIVKVATKRLPVEEIQEVLQEKKGRTGRLPDIEMPEDLGLDEPEVSPIVIDKLTDEEKAIFSYFVPVKGMETQLCKALTGVSRHLAEDRTACRGNLIIQGGQGCGKTVLATSFIKVLQKENGRPNGKVGKIDAATLNRKNVQELLRKVAGGCLIIERAGDISRETAVKLALLMESDSSGLVVVLEDTTKGIRKAMAQDEGFAKKFTEIIHVPIFTNDELVSFAKAYAKELGYEIDELAILALYKRISNIQRLDQATTLTEVKEIVDEAIDREAHGGIKKAISILTAARYTDDDCIILREKDFN